MAKRPAYTLILLGAERTDRVDVGPGPNFPVLAEHHHASQGGDDPVQRLEASLVSTPKVGKQVWLLWEGASAHVLDMPAGVVEGLERAQLADTLSFEAEPLTGIPSGDSAIDGVPQSGSTLAEFKRFWITQVTVAMRERLEEAVTRANAKLAGIVHPGGLPRADWKVEKPGDAVAEWRRVEVWDQLTFVLHGTRDGRIETKVIRSSPGSKAWTSQVPTEGPLSWMGPAPVTRVGPDGRHVSDAPLPVSAEGVPVQPTKIEFPQDKAPTDWLRAWAAELAAKPRRVPVVESSSQVSPHRKFYIVGGVAASLALAAVLAHGGLLTVRAGQARDRADQLERVRVALAPPNNSDKETAQINAEIERLKPRLAELLDTETALAAQDAKIEKVAAETAARQTRLSQLQSVHGPALGELLAALADAEKNENPAEIIVKEVRQDSAGALQLTGLCSQPAFADAFATQLESRLAQSGWKVGAAQKSVRSDKLAFDFSIVLTPAVLDSAGTGLPNLVSRPAATRPKGTGGPVEAAGVRAGDHTP